MEAQQKPLVSPSILSADFTCLGEEVKNLALAGADSLHIDVMDGHFVPQLSMGPPLVKSLKSLNQLPLEVHLMVKYPENFIDDLIKAGASLICFHIEASSPCQKLLKFIRKQGLKAALAIKPQTSAHRLFDFFEDLDRILLMTVPPGKGGQKLLKAPLAKIPLLKKELKKRNLNVPIQVDGGVNLKTLPLLKEADILVSGSFIFESGDYKKAIQSLKKGQSCNAHP